MEKETNITAEDSKETELESVELVESKKELIEEIDGYKNLAEERLSDLKYLQADFDNYRKKFEKEKEHIIRLANENLIKELIVILDDFESSIKHLEDERSKEGVSHIKKKFYSLLQKHGLKEIEALGKKYDPHFHEVLCRVLSEHEDDIIIEEVQKGYMLGPKLIRPSKVKISTKTNSQNLKSEDLK